MSTDQLEQRAPAASPEEMVGLAVAAARRGESELHAVLATSLAPIYTTDAEGWITFYNQPCIQFAGRMPVAGEDRWCVTWKLYGEDGSFLPHEDCPMAVAIKEKRAEAQRASHRRKNAGVSRGRTGGLATGP